MGEAATKLPLKSEDKQTQRPAAPQLWRPFETLRREIDRMFDDFDAGFWRSPFRSVFGPEPSWRRELTWKGIPAVDISESEKSYEITAELPGMDEKNVEVTLSNGNLVIKGEKREEREEKKKDYYLSERQFGSFERRFPVPDDVDTDKIEASFKQGVLTVTLPKRPEAQKPEKKISIKST